MQRWLNFVSSLYQLTWFRVQWVKLCIYWKKYYFFFICLRYFYIFFLQLVELYICFFRWKIFSHSHHNCLVVIVFVVSSFKQAYLIWFWNRNGNFVRFSNQQILLESVHGQYWTTINKKIKNLLNKIMNRTHWNLIICLLFSGVSGHIFLFSLTHLSFFLSIWLITQGGNNKTHNGSGFSCAFQ